MTLSLPLLAESGFGDERSRLPLAARIVRLGRRLFPVKTARQLAARAGVTHRAAELWLEERTGLSGEALAELLRSDIGFAVLEEIMDGARPQWWPQFRQSVALDALERRAEENRAEIAALRAGLAGPRRASAG